MTTYDFADRPATLLVQRSGHADQSIVSSAAYKPFGPLASLTLGNGLTETHTFTQRYFPSAITLGSLLSWTYTTDNVGNVATITDTLSSANNRTYGYQDDQYFLALGNGPWGPRSWTYDKIGNRLTETRGPAPPAGEPFPQAAAVTLSMESSMGSSELADQPYAKIVCDCNKDFKWVWVDPPVEPYRGCIAPCVAVHENDHIKWLRRNRPHSCKGRGDGDDPNVTTNDKNCTECSAYKASSDCMRKALAQASQSGMSSYCQFVLRQRELPSQTEQQQK